MQVSFPHVIGHKIMIKVTPYKKRIQTIYRLENLISQKKCEFIGELKFHRSIKVIHHITHLINFITSFINSELFSNR